MKSYALLITCTIIAAFSGNSFAALVGSPRPVAQENFQKLIKTNECPSCDLAGVVLTRVDLSGANLEGANLAGAKMHLTNLSGANLKNANLQGAGLGGADLAGADLRGANLTGAVLEGAYLKGAQIDGRIVARKPYETEGLSGVSEKKHVDEESRGKHVPYTQDVVIADRRDLGESPPVVVVDSSAAQSKKLIPMADAVVHHPDSEKSGDVEEISDPAPAADEPAAEIVDDSGLWGTVTSFFDDSSPVVEDEAEVVTPVEQESTAQVVDQPVDEIVADRTEEIVVSKEAQPVPVQEEVAVTGTVAEPEAVEPGQETASGEQVDDSGFWGSVTSIFSSGDDEKQPGEKPVEKAAEEMAAQADEVAADTAVQTARAELAPDAGVMAMIEQIEGPSSESDKVEVVEQEAGAQEEIVVSRSEEVVSQVDEVVAVPSDSEVKSDDVMIAEPEKVSVAEEAIVTEAPDQVDAGEREEFGAEGSEPVAGNMVGDMVYGVETPEQARAKQQIYIDKLLDEDRCVDCDLAGVDLSGKNLDEVDLERANLQGANLEGVDLSEANLKGVNFSGANLKNADLREADLYLADFTGADLTGAELEGALIDSADFTDATGTNLDTALKEE